MNNSPIRLRAGVVTQLIDGGMLLLDTQGGNYYDLNRSGSLMLQRLLDGADRAETVAAVEAQFLTNAQQVGADLEVLLEQLQQAGLVERVSPCDDQPAS